MSHDQQPLCRFGQGTSQTVWTGGFWHEPHTPPHNCRTVHVWLRGDDAPLRGFHGCGMWVVYDRHGAPVHVEDDTVIGWQDIPTPPAVVPPVRSTATELAVVALGVVGIMVAMWWWPVLGLGAAAMAATFAVACWAGGGK